MQMLWLKRLQDMTQSWWWWSQESHESQESQESQESHESQENQEETLLTTGLRAVTGQHQVGEEAVQLTQLSRLARRPLLLLGPVHLSQVLTQGEPGQELEGSLKTSEREQLLALECPL